MGSILTPAIDAIRKIDLPAAEAAHAALVEALAIKANGIKGYRPQHGRDGGEMATTLDTLPVLVRYELTDQRGSDIAEVTEVSIAGHTLDAGNFAADLLAAWGSECMAARAAVGL